MNQILSSDRVAYLWGRLIARYSRSVVAPSRVQIVDEANYLDYPAILAGWHAANLISLALLVAHHPTKRGVSFAPTGATGTVIKGWLDGIGGIEAVHLPSDNATGTRAALRSISLAISDGAYAVVAVDGPHGPAGVVRPGTIWLARHTGVPIVPIGFAAWPAVRVPRWDRLIVPLPTARIVVVVGKPIRVARGDSVDRVAANHLGAVLDDVTARAWSITGGRPSYRACLASMQGEET